MDYQTAFECNDIDAINQLYSNGVKLFKYDVSEYLENAIRRDEIEIVKWIHQTYGYELTRDHLFDVQDDDSLVYEYISKNCS